VKYLIVHLDSPWPHPPPPFHDPSRKRGNLETRTRTMPTAVPCFHSPSPSCAALRIWFPALSADNHFTT